MDGWINDSFSLASVLRRLLQASANLLREALARAVLGDAAAAEVALAQGEQLGRLLGEAAPGLEAAHAALLAALAPPAPLADRLAEKFRAGPATGGVGGPAFKLFPAAAELRVPACGVPSTYAAATGGGGGMGGGAGAGGAILGGAGAGSLGLGGGFRSAVVSDTVVSTRPLTVPQTSTTTGAGSTTTGAGSGAAGVPHQAAGGVMSGASPAGGSAGPGERLKDPAVASGSVAAAAAAAAAVAAAHAGESL